MAKKKRQPRYIINPTVPLTAKDRKLAEYGPIPGGKTAVIAATLLVAMIAVLPAVLIGALAAHLVGTALGVILGGLTIATSGGVAGYLTARPYMQASKGGAIRDAIAPANIVDLKSKGMTPERKSRIKAAQTCSEEATRLAEDTGHTVEAQDLLAALSRDAWRVARKTAAAANLPGGSSIEPDIEAEETLSAMQEALEKTGSHWVSQEGILLGKSESLNHAGAPPLSIPTALDVWEKMLEDTPALRESSGPNMARKENLEPN